MVHRGFETYRVLQINQRRKTTVMKNSSTRKSAFLGMPHGTATNRLRKLVLFDLLRRHNENVCFKCTSLIETADELSIEHKQPWEGRDVNLFWDLNNIAFSHLRCNTQHQYNPVRIFRASGTNWCSDCKDFKPVSEFNANNWHWTGYDTVCKTHKSQRNKNRQR